MLKAEAPLLTLGDIQKDRGAASVRVLHEGLDVLQVGVALLLAIEAHVQILGQLARDHDTDFVIIVALNSKAAGDTGSLGALYRKKSSLVSGTTGRQQQGERKDGGRELTVVILDRMISKSVVTRSVLGAELDMHLVYCVRCAKGW